MGLNFIDNNDDFDIPVINQNSAGVKNRENSALSYGAPTQRVVEMTDDFPVNQVQPGAKSYSQNIGNQTQPGMNPYNTNSANISPAGANTINVAGTINFANTANNINPSNAAGRNSAKKVDLKKLLEEAREDGCSDIHITAGTAIAIRKFGELKILRDSIPTLKESEDMIYSLMDEADIEKFKSGKDVDIATADKDGNRMRVNVYRQRNNIACSIRLINSKIPTLEELGMPPAVKAFADSKGGLVLITGPTGSGKSTTLASMINYINGKYARHIMTIEDPIEYVYPFDKAMIHQRQVGKDADSFASALRSSLREDPDIILVGEMRDYETISAAITAAETGHLVFSTLHTKSAGQTIERIISESPIEAHQSIISQLSTVLVGCVTQELVPLADGTGRVAATEVLINNMAITNLIKEKKLNQINSTLQTNMSTGMHTLNNSLLRLVRSGKITSEEAMAHSNARSDLSKDLLSI